MFRFITLALLISGCASQQVRSSLNPKEAPTSIEAKPRSEITPKLNSGLGLVVFNPVKGYATAQEAEMIRKAGEKLNETVKTQCFHDYLSRRAMIQTKNLSSQEVADQISILSGLVDVSMYFNRWSKAMAYREPPQLKINLNRKYFTASKSLCHWASTMGHEALGHALGNFEHSFRWTKERDYSVPYSIGSAVDTCCK